MSRQYPKRKKKPKIAKWDMGGVVPNTSIISNHYLLTEESYVSREEAGRYYRDSLHGLDIGEIVTQVMAQQVLVNRESAIFNGFSGGTKPEGVIKFDFEVKIEEYKPCSILNTIRKIRFK